VNTGTLIGSLVMAAVLVVVIALVIRAMLRGWRRRAEQQIAAIGTLPPLPDTVGPALIGPTKGIYVGSTLAGNWIDRVVVGDLGFRTKAVLTRYPEGIMLQRTGAHPIWIPDESIVAIRTEPALAGKVVVGGTVTDDNDETHEAILAIRWRLPSGAQIDTGFRGDDRTQYGLWLGKVT